MSNHKNHMWLLIFNFIQIFIVNKKITITLKRNIN